MELAQTLQQTDFSLENNPSSWGFVLWSRLVSNQRPSACEADALPLSYETWETHRSVIDGTSEISTDGGPGENRSARCDISERDWSPPSRPADCEFDHGQGISLSPGRKPTFVRAGDTALGGGQPLAYGTSISVGVLQCDSTQSGITCRDTATGRGFAISREAYQVF